MDLQGSKNNPYSFSRLESFNTCPLAFYYTYVEGDRGEQNVYGYLGGKTHEILEELQKRNIENDKAVELFNEACEEADFLDMRFMSDSVGDNYKNSVLNYLENYKPIECDEFLIEQEFLIEINGIWIKGFIDLVVIERGLATIIDYKTSSKFSKKDLPKKVRQLILYAYALEQLRPDLEIKEVKFDMLKYAINKRGTLKLRSEFDMFTDMSEYKTAYISAEYNEDTKNELLEYIASAVDKIKSLDINDELAWSPSDECGGFFCKNVCSHRDKCVFC